MLFLGLILFYLWEKLELNFIGENVMDKCRLLVLLDYIFWEKWEFNFIGVKSYG